MARNFIEAMIEIIISPRGLCFAMVEAGIRS
jgi:hypothetical protein